MADSDDKIKISELDPALTLNNTSETVVNQQVSGNWVTFKMTIATLAAHILEVFSSSSLRTTNKTVIGAINELQQGGGGGGSSTLAGLTDVDISSPTNGQILKYNGATDKWENGTGGGGGASALTDLSDVNVSAPSNGQSLIFDNATGKWVNGNALHNYSTNEKLVGTWIDGKPLYEKTFYSSTFVGFNTDTDMTLNDTIPTGIDIVETIGSIDMSVSAAHWASSSAKWFSWYVDITDRVIRASQSLTSGTLLSCNTTFTLRYTKQTT